MENKINDGHYLELMDRLHVLMATLDDHILNHPLTDTNEDIKEKLEEALTLLWETYQMVGSKMP